MTSAPPPLTRLQRRVMAAVYWCLRLDGETPTHREIARLIGWGGPGGGAGYSVPHALRTLEGHGLIERDHCRSGVCRVRAIRLTDRGRAWCPAVTIDTPAARAVARLARRQQREATR